MFREAEQRWTTMLNELAQARREIHDLQATVAVLSEDRVQLREEIKGIRDAIGEVTDEVKVRLNQFFKQNKLSSLMMLLQSNNRSDDDEAAVRVTDARDAILGCTGLTRPFCVQPPPPPPPLPLHAKVEPQQPPPKEYLDDDPYMEHRPWGRKSWPWCTLCKCWSGEGHINGKKHTNGLMAARRCAAGPLAAAPLAARPLAAGWLAAGLQERDDQKDAPHYYRW